MHLAFCTSAKGRCYVVARPVFSCAPSPFSCTLQHSFKILLYLFRCKGKKKEKGRRIEAGPIINAETGAYSRNDYSSSAAIILIGISLPETEGRKKQKRTPYTSLVHVIVFRFSWPLVSGSEIAMDAHRIICIFLSLSY